MTKNEIRFCYELKAHGLEIPDKTKQSIRKHFKAQTDKLAKSIREDWRKFYRAEDGESWYEYRILNGKLKDEEVEDYAEYIWRNFYGPYDCTGQPVTQWIRWKRVPAGIILVHKLALDV